MRTGKTLVTGGTGFTGGKLCHRLASEGDDIVTFVSPASLVKKKKDIENLRAKGVECREVDLKDRERIMQSFDDIDTVYHLAAAYRTEHSHQDEFRLVNVEGTRNLLDASVQGGVKRFVHCSTVGVQGGIDHPPADEEYRFEPGDHYQESKKEGELLARHYFEKGLPGVVVRPVGIYGPGDTRFLKLFRAVKSGTFVMIGNGQTLYHMTYIDDLIDGFVLSARNTEIHNEVFNIGGEDFTSIRELVNMVADILGKSHPRLRIPFWPVYQTSVLIDQICRPFGVAPPLYPRRVEFFHKDRAFSIEKAKSILGYQPKVSLTEGLAKTAEWYKKQDMI